MHCFPGTNQTRAMWCLRYAYVEICTDFSNTCLVQKVRAGTGGDEACLFAADLLLMYRRFASAQGWRFEDLESAAGDAGGVRFASAAIAGDGVYGRLKYESGVHRVQRVPATETQGRLHTSAASVAVLLQAEEVRV